MTIRRPKHCTFAPSRCLVCTAPSVLTKLRANQATCQPSYVRAVRSRRPVLTVCTFAAPYLLYPYRGTNRVLRAAFFDCGGSSARTACERHPTRPTNNPNVHLCRLRERATSSYPAWCSDITSFYLGFISLKLLVLAMGATRTALLVVWPFCLLDRFTCLPPWCTPGVHCRQRCLF